MAEKMIWEDDYQVDNDELNLHYRLGGYCPVQGEGSVAGKRFYFRSRHDEWTFAVAETEDVDPVDVFFPEQGFVRSGPYGVPDGFDAGYMSLGEAEDIIEKCAAEYIESHRE